MGSLRLGSRDGMGWRPKGVVQKQVAELQTPVAAMPRADAASIDTDAPGLQQSLEDGDGESESTRIIQELLQGNKAYAAKGRGSGGVSVSFPQLLDHVVQTRLEPKPVKAIILLDSRSLTGAPTLLGALPGETRSIRVIGNVLEVNDGVAGAVEFLSDKFAPPVILILGNSGNRVIESAVRVALAQQEEKEKEKLRAKSKNKRGKDTTPEPELAEPNLGTSLQDTFREEDFHVVRAVLPVALEALKSRPRATFEKLVEVTGHLHIWRTIENLLLSSRPVFRDVQARKLQIHGAYLNNETGNIRFIGEHPALPKLIKIPPMMESSRTGDDPPVPADEALAQLVAGNARYSMGQSGELKPNAEVRKQLSEHGQNPIAVILGCADSRAPTEIIFDMRPGDLFVLRNAGNTCAKEGGGNLMGSVEFAILKLRCKLIVVNGHTQCGAVTGAVEQVRNQKKGAQSGGRVEVRNGHGWVPGTIIAKPKPDKGRGGWLIQRDMDEDGHHQHIDSDEDVRILQPKPIGSIGHVLESIMDSAVRAVAELPGAPLEEQVSLAIKYNSYNSIKTLIRSSEIIRSRVISGEVQVHGAIYDLRTSDIHWLGQHPDVEDIVGAAMPLFRWKVSPYRSNLGPSDGRGVATEAIGRLKAGNRRFVDGRTEAIQSGVPATQPSAIVLASPEISFPIESMFDADPGMIVVQRALGGLEEGGNDMLIASIEYMVMHFKPPVLLVLGDSHSQLVDLALEQIHGLHAASSKTLLSIFSGVLVSALRAVNQTADESRKDSDTTEAAKQGRMKRLAVEMNALYSIEQLLLFSTVVREAVVSNRLELHVALLDENTGEVEFIGEHPMMNELIRQRSDA